MRGATDAPISRPEVPAAPPFLARGRTPAWPGPRPDRAAGDGRQHHGEADQGGTLDERATRAVRGRAFALSGPVAGLVFRLSH